VFAPPKPASKPAFEVVDDAPPEPAPPPRPAPRPAAPIKPPPVKPTVEADFEPVDDEPAKPKAEALDLDDDDRPRARRRPRDDEDDDRPRASRRSRDDEDDYDDRPRRRGRRDDYDDGYDDDYDDDRPRPKGNPFGPAKVGTLLVSISLWIYMGVFGLLSLFVVIGWSGGDMPEAIATLTGIVGLSNWLVAAVGIGFLIAGPKQARGLTIAAAVLSGVQLILMIVCFGKASDGGGRGGFGLTSATMLLFTSLIPVLDVMLPAMIYESKILGPGGKLTGELVVPALAGACEIARLILLLLSVKAVGQAARDHGAAEQVGKGVMIVSIVCGAAAVVVLLVIVIGYESKVSSRHYWAATAMLVLLAYTFMLLMPALAVNEVRAAVTRRANRGRRRR